MRKNRNLDQSQYDPMQQDDTEAKTKSGKSSLKDIYALLHDMCFILTAIVLVFVFIVRLVTVSGGSMNPTLVHGDLLALESNVIMGQLKPGDIIVAKKDSFMRGEPIIKRVIATEGQTIDIDYSTGSVYVDGIKLDEPYINEVMTDPGFGTKFPITVDKDCVYAMGDNRNHSSDSRFGSIGQIHKSEVLGKAVGILFPGKDESDKRDFSRMGFLNGKE